jgi:hypothetical protein
MNTLAFIAAALVLGLVVLAKIPGLEHTVRPAIDLVFTGLKAVLENSVSWSIWLFKMLLASHIEVIRHLVMSAESLDPSHEIRKMSDE